MEQIRREICDFIDDSDYWTDQKVATLAEISKQQFSKFRKNGSGLGFRKFLRVAYILFKGEASNYISKWCEHFDSTENIRQAFEYAYITRNKELLQLLLGKYKEEKGVIGECIKVYSFILKYLDKKVIWKDAKPQIKELKTINDKTLFILIELIQLYYYYHTNQFHLLLEVAEELHQDILALSDGREMFIKECYILRICEVLVPANFHVNNIASTRFYANILINSKICPKTISDGYYYLGMTYLIEDKGKCIEYLRLSYEVLSDHDSFIKNQALYNLNFVLAYYGEDLIDEKTCSSSLKALKEARLGNASIAIAYTEQAIRKEGNSNFKKFYYALALKSKVELSEVAANFFRDKNLFFYRVVAHEIINLDEETVFIDTLTKLSLGKGDDLSHEKNSFSCFNDIIDYRSVS
jgi:hypothetical protein